MSLYEGIVFMGVIHEKGFDNIDEISRQFPKRKKQEINQWRQWLVQSQQNQHQGKRARSIKGQTCQVVSTDLDQLGKLKGLVDLIRPKLQELYPGQNLRQIKAQGDIPGFYPL